MIREVQDGGLVGGGRVVDLQFIAMGEREDYGYGQISGVTFFAVFARVF